MLFRDHLGRQEAFKVLYSIGQLTQGLLRREAVHIAHSQLILKWEKVERNQNVSYA